MPASLQTRRRFSLAGASAIALALWLTPLAAAGYDPKVHQRLTFLAAKTLNRCLDGSDVAPLTPLQVRFVATSNMGLANTNPLVRMFRWSYFDAAAGENGSNRKFLGVLNTRFTEHFAQLVDNLNGAADEAERYRDLGRIVSYVQLVSTPTRALPVFSARFWRGSTSDRFDRFRLDEETLQAALAAEDCSFLADPPASYRAILDSVASDTRQAVKAPIDGLPATWEAFWKPGATPGDFGEYGPAGNTFGRKAEFPCGSDGERRCLLMRRDPLYADFALGRQVAAVLGTAQAMYLFQIEQAMQVDRDEGNREGEAGVVEHAG
jgi:hypothetical protein